MRPAGAGRRRAASAHRARERLLRALLGEVPVAGQPDERGDDAAPLRRNASMTADPGVRLHLTRVKRTFAASGPLPP